MADIAASGSPSSRRAWIEMLPSDNILLGPIVALLAEGVDRNSKISTKHG